MTVVDTTTAASGPDQATTAFIARWKASGGGELANAQSFIRELCDILGVPQPDATRSEERLNDYVFLAQGIERSAGRQVGGT